MNGIINFLKPPGMSSNGAVGFFKKTLNYKKIGHAGTLDPGACGVLVVLVGKATKLSDRLMNGDKEYIGQITFGIKTDTQDSYGVVLDKDDKIIDQKALAGVLGQFIGQIQQTPSRFSAIKINGKKAYQLARKGQDFKIKSREITIYSLEILRHIEKNTFLLKVRCSKGTYIRALFEDIGTKLDTVSYMSFLQRTQSGSFFAKDGFTCEEIKALTEEKKFDTFIKGFDHVLADMPRLDVIISDFKKISNGLPSTIANKEKENADGQYRVFCKNIFFGIGMIESDKVKLKTHLLEENTNEKNQ